ncbi:TLD-domain-containing protein [Pterulicium gracile]|uniref:Oxidation resistance protein 1 n=1 Tax=Pterulicium gracile TaxID=1884261 RepID=A0A5C3QN42_9AGAR|nr:TLD-domain-containing protein [Pterula gracilis]
MPSSFPPNSPPTAAFSPVRPQTFQIPAGPSASTSDPMTATDDNLISLATPDVEFGAFVSVPPASDPLSTHIQDDGFEHLSSSVGAVATTSTNAQAPNDDPESVASGSAQNRQSWAFFDEFTRDAKEKSEQKRKDVLEELLVHEDDPMYWVDTPRKANKEADSKSRPVLDLEGLNLSSEHGTDYHHGHHHHRPHHPPSSSSVPRLSPTRTTPPRLAPPLASTDSSSSLDDIDELSTTKSVSPASTATPISISRSQSGTDPTQPQRSQPQRTQSQSYQALSSLSAKFISSILGSAPTYTNPSTSIPPYPASFSSPPLHDLPHPNLSRTLSPSSSAFASHPYHFTPIPGAPGFVPEDSDSQGWDKDGRFYEDLERSVGSLRAPSSSNGAASDTARMSSWNPNLKQRAPWEEDARIPARGGHGRYATTAEGSSSFSNRNNSPSGSAATPSASGPSPGVRSRSAERQSGSGQGSSRSGSRAELSGTSRALMYGTSIKLLGRREGTEGVLDEGLSNQLRPHLPPLSRLPSSWSLLYSMDQHGSSLQTLYALSSATSRPAVYFSGTHASPPPTTPISNTLLIIRDESSRRFGVWLGGRIRQPTGDTVRRTERERFYGSGESFLWREVPNSPGVGNEHEGAVEVFKWTGMNEYVALCDEAFLSFGGGDGTYGLYIDAEMDGSSSWCSTFDNPPLSDMRTKKPPEVGDERGRKRVVGFQCVGLEVWGV